MNITPKIQLAITRAAILHKSQKSKIDGYPYIIHPFSVAFIVSNYTTDEDVVVAALLHDVLEDVEGYTSQNMREEFGDKVYEIVKELTEDKSPSDDDQTSIETWDVRKQKYIEKLRRDSQEALLICCADKVYNLNNILQAYKKYGDEIFSLFHASAGKQIWYYNEILKVFKEFFNHELVADLEALYVEAESLFPKD